MITARKITLLETCPQCESFSDWTDECSVCGESMWSVVDQALTVEPLDGRTAAEVLDIVTPFWNEQGFALVRGRVF